LVVVHVTGGRIHGSQGACKPHLYTHNIYLWIPLRALSAKYLTLGGLRLSTPR